MQQMQQQLADLQMGQTRPPAHPAWNNARPPPAQQPPASTPPTSSSYHNNLPYCPRCNLHHLRQCAPPSSWPPRPAPNAPAPAQPQYRPPAPNQNTRPPGNRQQPANAPSAHITTQDQDAPPSFPPCYYTTPATPNALVTTCALFPIPEE
ncbi:hypothetical protein DUNSADRAFT_2822 [Dunaliella salina]|uniref:Encoded protein n=1 Tax=Dunaliella salina TaxID=3046 RepID=A0ABZ3KBI0_DUNSA|nr:hypothetical protein DUNSADRAFT_2822 [Dunaliella salina]|eukprot:KAF5826528.1 hypothetical protein DUNSADRAFT_2822 [Dunaliella salina]